VIREVMEDTTKTAAWVCPHRITHYDLRITHYFKTPFPKPQTLPRNRGDGTGVGSTVQLETYEVLLLEASLSANVGNKPPSTEPLTNR
jgi:hypothetical protein